MALLLAPQISRAFRVGIYTGLGTASVIEAYTRWYLAKHWITDALGALVFGYLLLAVGTAAAAALAYSYGPPRRGVAPPTDRRDAGRPPSGQVPAQTPARALRHSYEPTVRGADPGPSDATLVSLTWRKWLAGR